MAVTEATAGIEYAYDVEATDPDGDVLTYQFAIGTDGAVSNVIASASGVAQGAGSTAWTLTSNATELQVKDASSGTILKSQLLADATGIVTIVGSVVSSIVKVAVVLILLPQSSVAVKITVAEPVAPQSSLRAVKK